MKTMIKIAAVLTAGFILAGCAGGPMGDYTGTDRGVDFEVDTLLGANVHGRSTTYKFGTEKPLGTLRVTPNGMDMTGPGVEIWARMAFCKEAPNAAECNGL